MTHWRASSLAGLLLTGRWRPLCSIVHGLPDSRFRRGFVAAMDRLFEPGHCRRIHDTWLIGAAVRGYEPARIAGRTGPKPGY